MHAMRHCLMRRPPSRYGASGEVLYEPTMACVLRGGVTSAPVKITK